MWQRRTFHECASELETISEDFRAAFINRWNRDKSTREHILRDTSTRGVEVLRILALAIRSDQDYGLTDRVSTKVGAFRPNLDKNEALRLVRNYQPPYGEFPDFTPLALRQALNKIAHANPAGSSFFADANTHDLVLTGKEERGRSWWLAAISLIDLYTVIKSLPDANTR